MSTRRQCAVAARLLLVAGVFAPSAAQAALQSHCAVIATPVRGEAIGPLLLAPSAGRIAKLYCKVTGGSALDAELVVEHEQAPPTRVHGTPLRCTAAGVKVRIPLRDQTRLAADDLMTLTIGAIAGVCAEGASARVSCTTDSQCPGGHCSVPSLSFCFVVRP